MMKAMISTTRKIIPLRNISQLRKIFGDKRIVLVGGCFDILHYGHVVFFEKAKKQGDLLVVALESDEFIRQRKNRESVHTLDQRAKILSHLTLVDAVVLLPLFKSYEEYLQFVKDLCPAVIAVTKGDPYLEEKQKQAREVGGEVVEVIPLINTHSTKRIIKYASIFSD